MFPAEATRGDRVAWRREILRHTLSRSQTGYATLDMDPSIKRVFKSVATASIERHHVLQIPIFDPPSLVHLIPNARVKSEQG
jgi:hypothetical protein